GRLRNPKFSAGSIRQYSGTARRSHRHLASSPTWVDGQSGAPFASPVPRSLISQPEICGSDTATRFVGSVPRYRLDCVVLIYSKVAIGTQTAVLMAASGGHPSCLRKSASTRSYSGPWLDIRQRAILRSATGTLALCLWSGRRRRACDRRTAASARSHRHLPTSSADGQGRALTLQLDAPPANANPSRISQIDPAQAQYIEPSIANSCARDNARASECPAHHWRAYTQLNVATCADELETKASQPCRYAEPFAGTTLL